MYDKDGNALEVDYAPTESTRGRKQFRTRSYSLVSQTSYNDSVCDSPVVNSTVNPDYTVNYDYNFDLYDIDCSNISKSDGITIKDDKSDEMEKFYDLYESMNDYLQQMAECVQSIKTIKLLQNRRQRSIKTLARTSSFHLLTAQDSKKSVEMIVDDDDERETEEEKSR